MNTAMELVCFFGVARILPHSPFHYLYPRYRQSPTDTRISLTLSGFGADPNNFHDVKIINVYYHFNDDHDLVYVELYSSSSNSWNVLHDFDANDVFHENYFYDSGVYANGVSYWLSQDWTHILCFDFSCNQFGRLDTPQIHGKIVEASDSIAYISPGEMPDEIGFEETGFEIWFLKEDSKWSNRVLQSDMYYRIHAIWKHGTEFEIVGGSDPGCLTACDSNGQTIREYDISVSSNLKIYKYMESIIPLSF